MKAADQDLVAGLKAGDESAFESLLTRFTPELHVIARRLGQSEEDAKDSVQDAFISAFRALDRFREGAPLRPWLRRIVRNTAIDKLRSRQSRRETPFVDTGLGVLGALESLDPTHHYPETVDRSLDMHHKCAVVWECLQDLPDSHRNVLLLRGVQELDTNETAEALGVSPGCTKVRLHRARRALRAMLAERSEPRAVFKSLPGGRHAGLGSAQRPGGHHAECDSFPRFD